MTRRRKIGLLGLGLLLLGLLLWMVLGAKSDEDQIREAIHQVAEGAEAADLGMSLEPISENYADPDDLDKNGIRGLLFYQFNKRGSISVWLSPIDVEVRGDAATASFEVGLVEGAKGSVVGWPVGAEAMHFEVELRREDGEWKITSHTRESVTQGGDTG